MKETFETVLKKKICKPHVKLPRMHWKSLPDSKAYFGLEDLYRTESLRGQVCAARNRTNDRLITTLIAENLLSRN